MRRNSLIAIVILGASCLAGGFLGTTLQADAERPEDELRTFSRVLALVEDNYIGETDSREMVKNAILGMLRSLDPHSNYLDPESFTEMRDEQRGRFSGLGIQIAKRGRDKPLTIIAPIDDTPAARANLQAGDIIFKIEGEETIELTVQDAVRRLKGDKGTKVTVTIKRPGLAEMFDVTLVRDDIPINSLRVAYMLDDTTGFLRLSNFTSTTARELDEAMARLDQQGMQRLVLDLRGTPGGLLEQAVQVSERFIEGGKLLVYTRGRVPEADEDYVARDGVERLDLPLIVLVDHSSASASEIVSGAIQDHDRGLVVGQPTFGKGLVQRVIPLRDGGALAVTTAKYYTPSGRLIQRDYTDLDHYYFDEPSDDPANPYSGFAIDPEDVDALANREVFYTASGRTVYGGGGITPDYLVKSPRGSKLFSRMFRENAFFDFAVQYAAAHPDLERGFRPAERFVADFKSFLAKRGFEYSEEEFADDAAMIAIRARAQVSRVRWGADEESRVLAEGDPVVQKALTLFDEANRLAQAGRRGTPGSENDRAELVGSPVSSPQ